MQLRTFESLNINYSLIVPDAHACNTWLEGSELLAYAWQRMTKTVSQQLQHLH